MPDTSLLEPILQYWHHYGIVGVLAIWPVLTAVLNMLFRFKSPEAWVVWADSNPKTKIIVDVIRGWGTDPTAALEAIQFYSQKKAEAQKTAPVKNEETKS